MKPPKGSRGKTGTTDVANAADSVLNTIVRGAGRGRQRMGVQRQGNGQATAVDQILSHWKAIGNEVTAAELPQARRYITDTLLTLTSMTV